MFQIVHFQKILEGERLYISFLNELDFSFKFINPN